jgi:hypothetical protein
MRVFTNLSLKSLCLQTLNYTVKLAGMNRFMPGRDYEEISFRTGVVSNLEDDQTEGVDPQDRLFWFIAPGASAAHPPSTLRECSDAYLDIAIDGPEEAIGDDANYAAIGDLPSEERRRLRIGSIIHHHTYKPVTLLPGEDAYSNREIDVYCVSPHSLQEDEFDDFKRRAAETLMPVLEAQQQRLQAVEDERIAQMPKVRLEESFQPFSLGLHQLDKWSDNIAAPPHVFDYGQAEHESPVFMLTVIRYREPQEPRSESFGGRRSVEVTPLSSADDPGARWNAHGSLCVGLGDDRYTPEELSHMYLYLKVVIDGQEYIAVPDKEHDATSQGCFSIEFNRFYPITPNMKAREIQTLVESGNSCVLIFPLKAGDDPRITNIEMIIGAGFNLNN